MLRQWGPQTQWASTPPTHTGVFRDCLFKPTEGHGHGLGKRRQIRQTLKKKKHQCNHTETAQGGGTGGRSGGPSAIGTLCREPGARHKSPGSAASSSSVVRKALCHQPHAPRPLNSGKIINAAGSVCAGEVAPVTSPRGESSSWETQRKRRFLPGELPAIQQLRGAGDHAEGAQTVPAPGEGDKGQG